MSINAPPAAGTRTAEDPEVVVTLDTGTAMLIDQRLPNYDVGVIEHRVIDASASRTWGCLTELDLMRVHTPLLDAAFFMRGLPSTVAALLGRFDFPNPPPPRFRLADAVPPPGWLALGRVPGAEIAFGAIGQFWRPDTEWYDVTGMSPAQFTAFAADGWGRIAASLSLRPYGEHRTLVSYEARTATTDEESTRQCARYWRVVRPAVSHILRSTLDALAEDCRATVDR